MLRQSNRLKSSCLFKRTWPGVAALGFSSIHVGNSDFQILVMLRIHLEIYWLLLPGVLPTVQDEAYHILSHIIKLINKVNINIIVPTFCLLSFKVFLDLFSANILTSQKIIVIFLKLLKTC